MTIFDFTNTLSRLGFKGGESSDGDKHNSTFAILTILFFIFIVYKLSINLIYRFKAKKLGCKPPATRPSDYAFGIRNAFKFAQAKNDGTLIDLLHESFNISNCNTFQASTAGRTITITRDPENIKAILGTQFNDFDLGLRYKQVWPLLGDGIFTLDAEGWKHSRSMLRPQFSREQVAHVKSLEPHMQLLFNHIRNKRGEVFDIQDYFFKFTIDTATEFLFGESCDSLDDGVMMNDEKSFRKLENRISDELKTQFPKAFNHAQSVLATRILMQNLYFLLNPASFRKSCQQVHAFTDFFVQKALDTPIEELEENSKGGYVFLYELVKQTRDPKVLRDQALNILLAGRDTTAGLLSFTFYELARNPTIFNKLKQEIYENFGSGKESKIDEISFESLKRCEYLKAVINEALRLYPSVPANFRNTNKATTLPRGGGSDELSPIFLPKGEKIIYIISSTHKRKDFYGEDAEIFRPERWFEESTRKLGWAYLPFNGGPRICLGQQFALTEASYVITRLIQEFPNIESHDPVYPPKKNSQLTMCLMDGANIRLF